MWQAARVFTARGSYLYAITGLKPVAGTGRGLAFLPARAHTSSVFSSSIILLPHLAREGERKTRYTVDIKVWQNQLQYAYVS